ncbi:MAG: hypothetical protein U5N86_03375 [Planctomycetota bacterium]|nr:hypothetical protein [Planctomycetota bacterium]
MKWPLLSLAYAEVSGLAQAAFAAAFAGSVLLQLLDKPEAVVLFAVASAVVFAATAAGFRRKRGELEFILSRNISRASFVSSRFFVGLLPMALAVAFVCLNLFLPVSDSFWGLFVESGFVDTPDLAPSEGLGWAMFALFGAGWAYSVAFLFVSRTTEASGMFLALLAASAAAVTVPLLFFAMLSVLGSFGLVQAETAYDPASPQWFVFYPASLLLDALALLVAIRLFREVDV